MATASTKGRGVRLIIDTGTDSYEQAIAAVQAAYGLRPDVPAGWRDADCPYARRPEGSCSFRQKRPSVQL